uniref:General transcriptional corepressor tupA n=2 Tax=Anthurium amnicola TaxID=1678845 RepID=A0A1D1YKA0_9ARAE
MSNIYNHRQLVPGGGAGSNRVNELFDALKQEFDSLQQEAAMYKMQRDDLEHKVQQQTDEVNLIRQGLYDLQATQKNMKAQNRPEYGARYDNELRALQRDIDQQRIHPHPSSSHAQPPPSHPQPPPPTIGQGQSNIFGAIMSGGGGGNQVLVAPPQMSIDQPPPGGQPGHPYPGPNGPPQNVPQSGGSSSQSPYLNGAGPAPLSQPQHGPKRQRMEDGPPPNGPMGLPNSQQAPSSMYNSNGMPPQGPPGQQSQGSYMNVGGSKPGPVSKMPKIPQNISEGPQSTGVPPNGPLSGAQSGLGDMDPENVPAQLKKEGSDWFAIFNPKVQRVLDVELFHTLDHNSVVCCVKFSCDGKYLATGCNRIAQIYDVHNGQKICVLDDTSVDKSGDLYIRSVCFSPDGKFLATGAEDKQIRIWDIHSQTIRKFFTGHEQDIYSLDFSRDGRFIVSGSGDKTARVWDMVSGELLYKLAIDEPSQKDAGVTSVAISPDALYVAAGSLDKIVRVWDTRTGYLLERLEGHKDSVYSVAFAPDGKTLVSGSLDKTLKLWDMSHPGRNGSGGSGQKNQSKTTFTGHKDFVLSVAVSPDGRWVVSGSKDRGVQFWDPITAQTQFMLQGHKNSVISVALSPTGKLFATGSGDCRARVWRYYDETM